MNTYVYQTVALVLQIAQAHNVTVSGCHKYNVPSGNITDLSSSTQPSASSLTSYSLAAITGADDFRDNRTTIKDLFDTIVYNTRKITPTCTFPIVGLYPFVSLTPFRIKSDPSGLLGTCRRKHFLRNYPDGGLLRYDSYGLPTRSVEQLPPYSPQKLKNPVLIIGNSVRTPYHLNRNYFIA